MKQKTPSVRDAQTEIIRQEMLKVANSNNGILNPADLVNAARDPMSPLHPLFEWDDSAAAEGFRLMQGAGYIRKVKLWVYRDEEDTNGRTIQLTVTRQFEHRPSMDGIGYEPVQDILSDETKRKELLRQAKKEMLALQKKYSALTELAEVWAVLDGIEVQ